MLEQHKQNFVGQVANDVSARWASLSHFRRFGIRASLVLLAGMVLIGIWAAEHVEKGIVQSVGVGVALNTNSLIVSDIQALKYATALTTDQLAEFDRRLTAATNLHAVLAFHIWKGDLIVASSDRSMIGKSLPATETRSRAESGVVSVEFDVASSRGGDVKHADQTPLLEVYAPVMETGTNRIIAVAETYVAAPDLQDQVRRARLVSWAVVGLTTLLILSLQILIIDRGGVTIDKQNIALKEKIDALSSLLEDNELLRLKANKASERVTEMNERYARQIGTDLHDGPVQLLALSLLRLDSLSQTVASADSATANEAEVDLAVIRDAMTETLQEIRSISTGLAPPNVDGVTLQGALELACRRHERRTGSSVRVECKGLPQDTKHALKTCLYRFTQEGLNNALRHAGGKGQAVAAWCDGDVIEVKISDDGPGLADIGTIFTRGGRGLVGMRDRIEALGGDFGVESKIGEGTRITARFSIREQQAANE